MTPRTVRRHRFSVEPTPGNPSVRPGDDPAGRESRASEYAGAAGYLKFVIERQPPEMQILLKEAARLIRQEAGWTNGYAIVQAWAMEIVGTYGHRSRDEAAGQEATPAGQHRGEGEP